MTDIKQVHEDLEYVRGAVNRRAGGLPGEAVRGYYFWAAYVPIGFTLLDFNVRYANWFLTTGALVGIVVGLIISARSRHRSGVIDRERDRQAKLHWLLGLGGSMAADFALAWTNPTFHGPCTGQVVVVMIGIVYLMWGIYHDRSFLVLGPVLMAGGVVVSLIPHFAWTSLGVVIAGGLVASGILAQRASARQMAA
jgi:hypothetical protein